MEWDGPILDNHLHLDGRRGRGIEAARAFVAAGGTHMLVVNKPSWQVGVEVSSGADFAEGFDATIELVERVSEVLPGRAWPVLGVHPALISRLVDERALSHERAEGLMRAGLDAAADRVRAGEAVALKSGRPHYPVDEAVWERSNAVLRHAIERAVDCDCALQLHTEATRDLGAVVDWADAAGLAPERVVKHYADGPMERTTASVIARKDALATAIESDRPFLMETDFLDDPDRPGAVLGPKTVPRRVAWMAGRGDTDALERAHVRTPRQVYGIDLRGP